MSEEFEDCNQELISSENLSSFSVVEKYCDNCGDLTPHHIEDNNKRIKKESIQKTYVSPIAKSECVYCRENEEQEIEGLN